MLIVCSPEELGLCPRRWALVLTRAEELCRTGTIPALSLHVQQRGRTTGVHHFGTRKLNQSTAVDSRTLFLVASLTKPMVAMATLILVERGQVLLNQQVHELLPEMKEAGKRTMTVRHLLTHTSGLPDMLPNNEELRNSHAPLSRFVEESCHTELIFPPGRTAQYQSMGYALLGEIIQRVSGRSCADFLQQELFHPLGMTQSFLGLPSDSPDHQRVAEIELVEPLRSATSWNWNSAYWRELGAPWGGVLTTAEDLAKFLRMMLAGRNADQHSAPLSPESLREAVENRLHDFAAISDSERRARGWGLGWRLNWKDHRHAFCDLLPNDVAGHWGATGTLFWIDPAREMGVVLLGTRPLNDHPSPLTGLSNMIAAAFV